MTPRHWLGLGLGPARRGEDPGGSQGGARGPPKRSSGRGKHPWGSFGGNTPKAGCGERLEGRGLGVLGGSVPAPSPVGDTVGLGHLVCGCRGGFPKEQPTFFGGGGQF